jgi:hypothetical protein
MQFLSPWALVALAALAIPTILHLWRPPATTIRIGTLKFFTGPAIRRLTKLRWRERLLLLVRLLLLTMLILLLARPIWNKRPPTTAQRWVLIEPGVALEGAALQRARSLARDGYQTRSLATGFPRIALPEKPSTRAPGTADVWSLVREADARLPSGSALAVFASDRMNTLRDERPALRSKVEWIGVPFSANSQAVLVSARSAERELHCIVESTDAALTLHTRATIPAANGTHSAAGFSIEVRDNGDRNWSARLLPDGEWMVVGVDAPRNVLILRSADRESDARYVAAALRAIGAKVDVQAFTSDTDATRADWIIWLNDEPVAQRIEGEIARRGVDLLQDAEGSRDAAQTAGGSISFDRSVVDIELLRRTRASDAGVPVWSDSSGAPLLTVERIGGGRRWRFFSRFHPEWSDLPRSSALPFALQQLLLDERSKPKIDHRVADRDQAQPAEGASQSVILAAAERIDLRQLFWSLAVLLFAAERALSYRSPASAAATKSARARKETPVLV